MTSTGNTGEAMVLDIPILWSTLSTGGAIELHSKEMSCCLRVDTLFDSGVVSRFGLCLGNWGSHKQFPVIGFSILQFLVMPRSAGGWSYPAVLILVRRIVLGWEDGVRGNDRYCRQELHNIPGRTNSLCHEFHQGSDIPDLHLFLGQTFLWQERYTSIISYSSILASVNLMTASSKVIPVMI